MKSYTWKIAALTAVLCATTHASAQVVVATRAAPIVPFLEDFENGPANFGTTFDNFAIDLTDGEVTTAPTGGVGDSALLTTQHALSQPSVVFRGEALLESSDLAFTGDWILAGVQEFSLNVVHDVPAPLQFDIRIATQTFPISDNFPGAFATGFDPVAPNTLTELSVGIDPANIFSPGTGQFGQIALFEGGSFEDIFSDVTNFQVTVDLADGFTEVSEDLVNVAANNPAIDLPAGAVAGDVFDSFTTVSGVLLVDELGDAILDDEGNQQFVEFEVPTVDASAIFNTETEFTFGLDNVALVPEPTAGLLLLIASTAMAARRRV